MATFAIIQLSRTENVIQTLQAAMELKQSHPEVQLLLICREGIAKPVEFKLREAFGQIIYLPDMDVNMDASVEKINALNIDVAINLSYSKVSSELMSLISLTHKLGFVSNEHNEIILNDRWSQFVYSNTMSGPYGCFNLVDIFKKVLGTSHNSYTKGHRNLKNKKIIIHPFTSQRKVKWPLGKWAEVIYQTLKNHLNASVAIIGTADERAEAERLLQNPILKKFHDRLLNRVGKQSIEDTYNEFRDASLFIGHDSLGGHLASLFNVQTLSISLGTMHPYEITPYGSSNYNIASRISCFPCSEARPCEALPCHQDISYNAIGAVIDILIEAQEISPDRIKEKVPLIFLDKIDIYRSYVDKDWGMSLVNCLHDQGTIIDVFRAFYRVLWGLVLADQELTLPFPEISREQYHILENYHGGLNHIIELNKFGRSYARYIIEEEELDSPNIIDIKKYSDKILQVDQFLIKLRAVYPPLAPLIDYYHISKANVRGTTIKEIAELSFVTYHEALGASEALQELIASTLDHSQHSKTTPEGRRKTP